MDLLYTFSHHTLAFIIVLSALVFIHEYGHYIIGKLSGVHIETFSIGFGKELFGWTDKSGTRWKVSLIPLGGYVRMLGDGSAASTPDKTAQETMSDEEKKRAFFTKPLWIKSLIVAAGPLANFLLAIVILTGFLYTYGKTETSTEVNTVMTDSAAASAGIEAGDIITSIDGQAVESFSDVQNIISLNTGTPVTLTVLRNDKTLDITTTPKLVEREDVFGNTIKVPLLGISSKTMRSVKLGIVDAFTHSFVETYNIIGATLKAIGQMVTGHRSLEEISGPIGIAKYSGQSMEKGWYTLLWFVALLSINLGLINLLPIPLLDGGHLFYYAIEAIIRKPIPEGVLTFGYRVGFSLIASLAIFAIVNDVIKLF